MQQIWAPWRMSYIQGEGETGLPNPGGRCIFCTMAEEPPNRDRLILYSTDHAFIVMNLFPYTNGHLLVVPKVHEPTFENLSSEVYQNATELVRQSIVILRQALKPEGLNVGANLGRVAGAGIPDHVHLHVVPRWNGDTNFMPVLGEVRVISEHILSTYDRLRPFFDQLGA